MDDRLPPRTPPQTMGGLHLPKKLGVAHSVAEVAHDTWSTFESVQEELAQRGLPPLPVPPYTYPGAITIAQLTTEGQDYSKTYVEHLAWYNYVAELVAAIRATLTQIENEMEDIASKMREDERAKAGKAPAVNAMKDLIEQTPRYRELKIEAQRFDQKKRLTEGKLDTMDRNLKLLSRQVEIKRVEFEKHRVGEGMQTRGGPRDIRG